MCSATVVTANHYNFDAIAGGTGALTGLGIAYLLQKERALGEAASRPVRTDRNISSVPRQDGRGARRSRVGGQFFLSRPIGVTARGGRL